MNRASASDKNAGTPRYLLLQAELCAEIRNGFQDGQRFYTQRELMQRYGYSYATVNRALSLLEEDGIIERRRGSGAYVRKKMQPRVRALGLLVYDIHDPFFSRICRSFEIAAQARGFHVVLCNTFGRLEREADYVNTLIRKKAVGGFAVCPTGKSLDQAYFAAIRAAEIPCVLFPQADLSAADSLDCVVSDDRAGAYHAVSHLFAAGYRRIAFVSSLGQEDIPTANRLAGFRQALAEHGQRFTSKSWFRASTNNVSAGREVAEKILAKRRRPDAVFTTADYLAAGIIQTLKANDLRIGPDMGVVGFDDLAIAASAEVSLTTVHQPLEEIGELAARILIGRCEGKLQAGQREILEPGLVIRCSTRR